MGLFRWNSCGKLISGKSQSFVSSLIEVSITQIKEKFNIKGHYSVSAFVLA